MDAELNGKKLKMRGRVVKVGGTETVGAKGFQKRLLLINDEDDRYPQDIPFWFVQDNVTRLDAAHEGDDVVVTFDLNGREWNGRYFAELRGWKVEKFAQSAPAPAGATEGASAEPLPF